MALDIRTWVSIDITASVVLPDDLTFITSNIRGTEQFKVFSLGCRADEHGRLSFNGRGYLIKKDGSIGKAVRSVLYINQDDIPQQVKAELRVALIANARQLASQYRAIADIL